MSQKEHKHYRHEKECLNCGYPVDQKFCSNCGQENLELKEPFWVLFAEGFSDFFHFDSKFTRSLIPLLFKPGFLTLEYNRGRRVRYIHPLRLYFFISVVMLLVSGYLFNKMDFDSLLKYAKFQQNPDNAIPKSYFKINNLGKQKLETQSKEEKSIELEKFLRQKIQEFKKDSTLLSHKIQILEEEKTILKQKIHELEKDKNLKGYSDSLSIFNSRIKKIQEESDSLRKNLNKLIENDSSELRVGGKKMEVGDFLGKEGPIYKAFEEFLTHNLKILLILLLPIFALFLKGLYFRKKIYYQEHLITMLHLQSFIILLVSLILFIPSFWPKTMILVLEIMALIILIYIFQTLKTVYQQNIFKTLLKTIIFIFFSFLTTFTAVSIYLGLELLYKIKG